MTTTTSRIARAAILSGLVAGTAFGVTAPAHAAVTVNPTVDTSTRAGALAAYNSMYRPALAVASGSTGNPSTCTPGTTSAAGSNAALTVINYYRSMAKLKATTANATWSKGAQASALMMAANGDINHTPPKTWKCYTTLGATTAGHSNLAEGDSTTGGSMAMYADDSGNDDTLGHRRWLLEPGLNQVGIGQVGAYNTLQVFGDSSLPTPSGSPAYIPWPAAGYVPKALQPSANTWSLTASDGAVDMSGATASVVSNGTTVPVTVKHLPNGYGKPTVEFKLASGYTGGADRAYTVTVSGMKKAGVALPAYKYTTTMFDESKSLSPQSISWTTPATVTKSSAVLSAKATSGLPVTFASSTPSVCSVSGTNVNYLAEGVCTLTAKQAGNATWAAVSTSRNISVGLSTKKAQTIPLTAPASASLGGSVTLPLATSGLTPTYTTSTPGVCTVSGRTLKFVNAGTCTVRGTQAGDATYNMAPAATVSFNVGGLRNNVGTWNVGTSVKVGQRVSLDGATFTGDGSLSAGASMDGANVCSFDGWDVTFGVPGTCTVTVTQEASSTYKSASVTKTFTVS